MRRLIVGLLPLIISAPLYADSLDDILMQLAARPLVRADYRQERRMPGLSKPQLSAGQMIFVNGTGVLLSVRRPAIMYLVMTSAVVVQKSTSRTVRLRLDQSAFGGVAGVFSYLANGDAGRIRATFSVDKATMVEGRWQLQLQPLEAQLRRQLTQVELSGDSYLREIRLLDSRGASSRMLLENFATTPELSDAERALFQLAD
jgi:hypothetical protein